MLYGNNNISSSEIISSSTKVLSSTSHIIYSAQKSILLQSGFSTQNGAVFEAKIEGCNKKNSEELCSSLFLNVSFISLYLSSCQH